MIPGSRVLVIGVVLFSLAFLATACGTKPVIRLHHSEYASKLVNNAIAELIIEEGYGYPVEMVTATTQEWLEALPEGRVNLDMEAWQQNFIDWYDEQLERGTIANLGMTYEAGPQFFVIPRWVAEEYGIQTVFDIKDHWELFQDPDDPSKGIFYNCLITWSCAEINKVKLEAYGLTRYYNVISSGSDDALEAALARSQERHQPVFGYYWAPTALMGVYDWHILEEPTNTAQCWEKVIAASEDVSLRPIDQACAYETTPIDKIAHKGLLEKAPDVVEMLKKMMVGLEPLNDTLAWASENDVQDWERAAVYYLQTYQDRWRTWVTQDAYEKIEEALEEARK